MFTGGFLGIAWSPTKNQSSRRSENKVRPMNAIETPKIVKEVQTRAHVIPLLNASILLLTGPSDTIF